MSGTLLHPELSAEHRAALVIATGTYADDQLARLRSPARDAEDLAAALGDPAIGAFNVAVLADRPAHEVRLGMQDFLSGRSAGDLLVVYLSCHGIRDARGRLYFAAADTRKTHLASTGIESGWLIERLDECKARRQVLILDCCFSGAFAAGAKGEGDLDLQRHVVGHGRGRVVLTASRAGEYSFEGHALPGAGIAGSVFTAGLVEGLRTGGADENRDGLVSVEDAYDYAYTYVQAHCAAQTPQRFAWGAEGRIWLARNPITALAPLADAGATRTHLGQGPVPAAPAPAPSEHRPKAWWRGVPSAVEPTPTSSLYAHLRGKPDSVQIPTWVLTDTGRDSAVVFSPDGTLLATAGGGPTVRLWDPHSSQPVGELRADSRPHSWITAVVFSPDGTSVATVDNWGKVRLWDPHARQPVGEPLADRLIGVSALIFSPDGVLLAAVGDSTVHLWDPRTRRPTGEILTGHSSGYPSGVLAMFSPDGTVLATAGKDATVRLWDPHTRKALGPPLAGHTDAISAAAFSPDGALLATADTKIRLWDPHTRQPIGKPLHGHYSSVKVMAFSPDGSLLATSDGMTVQLWNPHTGKSPGRYPLVGETSGAFVLAFSPDGSLLATAEGSVMRLWDPRRRTTLGSPMKDYHCGGLTAAVFSPDGTLLTTVGENRTIRFWEVGRSTAR